MKVTVILVSYNSGEYIEQCLNSVIYKTESVEYDIIVIDNASSDNTAGLIRSKFPGIKLIVNKANIGFAKAVNQAAKESGSEYVFLLNPDTVLMNDAVKIFSDYMEIKGNEKIGCAGGTLFHENGKPALSYGYFPSLKQVFFEAFGLRKLFKKYYSENLSPGCYYEGNSINEVDYICGADLFIRKNVFDETGGFDEDFFLYYEETEFCFRLKKKGLGTVLIPNAKIIHFEGKSAGESDFNIMSVKKKSEFLFFTKCRGGIAAFTAKLIYLSGSVLKFILRFDTKQYRIFKMILKS